MLRESLQLYEGPEDADAALLDLSTTLQEIVPMLKGSLPRGVSLQCRLEAGLPPVEVDKAELGAVVAGLARNAEEATTYKNGSITIGTGVEFRHEPQGRQGTAVRGPDGLCVYFEVTDTGRGIERDAMRRLGDPFFTTKGDLLGLGLFIACDFARRYGGGLNVRCMPEGGTCVTLYLPASRQRLHHVR